MANRFARFQHLSVKRVISRTTRSVAGQVLIFQVALVVLLVACGVVALILQSERDTNAEARRRSTAVAQTFAHSPGVLAALQAPDPSKILQPLTEAGRRAADVDFIVVMNTKGIRYTHPLPDRIGKRFVGEIGPSLAGKVFVESVDGPLGREVQATVPIENADAEVVGLVSAGMKVKNVQSQLTRQLPIILGAGAGALALSTGVTALVGTRLRRQTHSLAPDEMTLMYEHHDTVLHSVREGVLIVAADGRLMLANDEARRLLELPPDIEGRLVSGLPGLDPETRALLTSGREATDEVHLAGERLLAVNQRPTEHRGGPKGTVVTLRDSTELQAVTGRAEVARERLRLLYDAGLHIGTTLDVLRTADELARVPIPRFADFVTVDLADAVLHGDEPTATATDMRRAAVSGIRDDHPLSEQGRLFDYAPSTPQARGYGSGHSQLVSDLPSATSWRLQDPERARAIIDYGIHSLITAPIRARGVVLGMASFWRGQQHEPFNEEDLSLAEELVARAAISIDNARRYTREHALAVTLQQSLLPQAMPEPRTVLHRRPGLGRAQSWLPDRPGLLVSAGAALIGVLLTLGIPFDPGAAAQQAGQALATTSARPGQRPADPAAPTGTLPSPSTTPTGSASLSPSPTPSSPSGPAATGPDAPPAPATPSDDQVTTAPGGPATVATPTTTTPASPAAPSVKDVVVSAFRQTGPTSATATIGITTDGTGPVSITVSWFTGRTAGPLGTADGPSQTFERSGATQYALTVDHAFQSLGCYWAVQATTTPDSADGGASQQLLTRQCDLR
ncbi:GAF domain-containing protein [Streptomyces sp. NPDC006265]|uniref:GAF domain-containing protein n=1 Tax=Streptomyces sp. NPDC006265 TaxID=3156740 RepID=UPI0033B7ADB3